ncbi:MAG: hypothetical protein F4X98_00415 [Gammaproteobacteria bacterium]|nr:hypothetical protein [Gammaproteobacteria bacterium]
MISGLLPAIVLVVVGCAGGPTTTGDAGKPRGVPPPALPEARRYDMPVRREPPEGAAEAQHLLGAANIVGGLWRLTIDPLDWRGHESIARGAQWMRGVDPGLGQDEDGPLDPRLVEAACSTVCPFVDPVPTVTAPAGVQRRFEVQYPVFQSLVAARKLLRRGAVERVVQALDKIVRDNRVTQVSLKNLRVAGGLKRARPRSATLSPLDRAVILDWLANAHLLQNNIAAAIAAYEEIVTLEDGLPSKQLDGTRERLAHLNFVLGNYGESLAKQRVWLRRAEWVGQACPKVCGRPHTTPVSVSDVAATPGVQTRLSRRTPPPQAVH